MANRLRYCVTQDRGGIVTLVDHNRGGEPTRMFECRDGFVAEGFGEGYSCRGRMVQCSVGQLLVSRSPFDHEPSVPLRCTPETILGIVSREAQAIAERWEVAR